MPRDELHGDVIPSEDGQLVGRRRHQMLLQEILGRQGDLILIGRHSHNSLEDILLGSVARHVLNRADCDVLVCSG